MLLKNSSVKSSLIAPCGMNCAVCIGYLREKNKCNGCNSVTGRKPEYCIRCAIKNSSWLAESKGRYCYSCIKYPCKRLKQLDKRYRTKYGVSLIGNLENIKVKGIRSFVRGEKSKWQCNVCSKVLSIHRANCIHCGSERT